MERTQIYLTKKEREALQSLAEQTGESQSALIRQAIDRYLIRFRSADRDAVLRQAKGMWRDRTDLPDIRTLREEFDRTANSQGGSE